MKKLPAFQFYPADWRKDPGVQSLSFHDRGVWFEILCLMHESPQRGILLMPSGGPMSSVSLARIIGLSLPQLIKSLDRIAATGVSSRDQESGALINRRMIRDEELRTLRTQSGKLGGNPVLVNQNSTKTTTEVNHASNQKPTPSSSSSFSSSSSPSGKGSGTSAAQNGGTRPRDAAMDLFVAKCLELTGSPYGIEAADAVMLAKLRKAGGTANFEKPNGWEAAVENYFASPLAQYSLADLANPKRYAVFKNSALDEFKTPISHINRRDTRGRSKTDRTREATQELLREFDQQDCRGDECGIDESDDRDIPGKAYAAKS